MNIKQYKNKVASLGCIISGQPAELHHPRFTQGMSQRASDWLVIPLSKYHHRTGPFGQAVHNGQHIFELNYGKEADLLAMTIKRVMEGLK